MKDKRNCGMYPVYPTPMMPMANQPFPVPYQTQTPYYTQVSNNTLDINSIESRLNTLENKVNRLEQMMSNNYPNNNNNSNNTNNYTDSNYYMV